MTYTLGFLQKILYGSMVEWLTLKANHQQPPVSSKPNSKTTLFRISGGYEVCVSVEQYHPHHRGVPHLSKRLLLSVEKAAPGIARLAATFPVTSPSVLV